LDGRTEVKQYTYFRFQGGDALEFSINKKKAQPCIGISINYFCEFGANLCSYFEYEDLNVSLYTIKQTNMKQNIHIYFDIPSTNK
jgi:hypothetical protein